MELRIRGIAPTDAERDAIESVLGRPAADT